MATPTLLWMPFAWSIIYHFEHMSVFGLLKLVSWRKYVVESCFLIYPDTTCLLIGEFMPFKFRMIIDIWGLSIDILCFIFWLLCIYIISFPYFSVFYFGLVVSLMFFSIFSFFCFMSQLLIFVLWLSWGLYNMSYRGHSPFSLDTTLFSFACTNSITFFLPFYIFVVINYLSCCMFITKLK